MQRCKKSSKSKGKVIINFKFMNEQTDFSTTKKPYEVAYEEGRIGLQDYLKALATDMIRAGATKAEVQIAVQDKLTQILRGES